MRDSAAVLHDNFPVLASALMVCRTCLALDADSLAHIVRLLDTYLNPFSRSWSVRRACELGLPRRAIEYLAARDPHWVDGYDIGALASKGGFVHVLQWALDCYPSRIAWDNGYTGYDRITLMDVAAQHGHLPVLQLFHENRSEGCSHRAMDYAAGTGRLDIVWWLEEHYTGSCSTRAMDDAATNGHLEVVKWLHLNHHEGCTKYAMNGAAQNGHLAVLEWLHANRSEGYAPSEGVMDSVAACGHLDVLKTTPASRARRTQCSGRPHAVTLIWFASSTRTGLTNAPVPAAPCVWPRCMGTWKPCSGCTRIASAVASELL